MRHLAPALLVALLALAGSAAAQGKKGKALEFKENESGKPGLSEGVKGSSIEATETEAALKFTILHKQKGPIVGVVVKLTGADGKKFYTEESDAKGYAEVLVPAGQTYEVEYLSLGRKKIAAKVPVSKEPKQTIKLTLRYNRDDDAGDGRPRFVLKGVEFDTDKAKIRPESFERLDTVVEFMEHKKSARIEISGHTDNQGKAATNKKLSKKRAQAVRKYILSKGIKGNRVTAVGYGDTRPIAPNDSEEGRQRNRRIEATEL